MFRVTRQPEIYLVNTFVLQDLLNCKTVALIKDRDPDDMVLADSDTKLECMGLTNC